ncbi:MAG: MFS transporter [Propionibacteriales bacterium]|nr:MFS transporter [Propionibacteriales bacterium]
MIPDHQERRGSRLPVAVYILGAAIFAQGTSELMLAGLLPEIAVDLGVGVPQAGLLISGFALGMLIGAPILAILTVRWPRRLTMVGFLGVFILSHIAGALAPSYGVLLATRFVGAFVYAGFWAVGGSTVLSVVAPDKRGRAMGIFAGGLTVATVIGLPAGTWLGQQLGWRGAFWAVALITIIAAVAVLVKVPRLAVGDAPRMRTEVAAMRNGRLWLSYALTATSIAAVLGTFSYLGAMVLDAGLAPELVPLVMLGYGIGALVGMTVGGRAADTRPMAILVASFAGVAVLSVLLGVAAGHPAWLGVLASLLGLAGFASNPALNSRVFEIAPEASRLSVAGNISAFNAGISLGPWLAGLALTAGAGFAAVPTIGAALAALALLLLGVEAAARRRASARRSPQMTPRAIIASATCRNEDTFAPRT